jgi:hypothetical protein
MFKPPVNPNDGVTLSYLDASVSDAVAVVADDLDNAVTELDENKVNRAGDTMGGVLNMNSHKIQNLPNPIDDFDAVRKLYVEENYLKKASDTAEGPLHMGGFFIDGLPNPTSDSMAAPKVYVDQRVNRSGDTMEGGLDMNNHHIDGLPTPVSANQAVPKSYVDNFETPRCYLHMYQNTDITPKWGSGYVITDWPTLITYSGTFINGRFTPDMTGVYQYNIYLVVGNGPVLNISPGTLCARTFIPSGGTGFTGGVHFKKAPIFRGAGGGGDCVMEMSGLLDVHEGQGIEFAIIGPSHFGAWTIWGQSQANIARVGSLLPNTNP